MKLFEITLQIAPPDFYQITHRRGASELEALDEALTDFYELYPQSTIIIQEIKEIIKN